MTRAPAASPPAASSQVGGLGTGVLWRPGLGGFVLEAASAGRLGFVEVIAESLHGGLPPALAAVRGLGVTLVPHGVGLGLGGARPPDRRRLRALARAAELCDAPLVSEHVALVRAGGHEAGHLLPVQRTREGLDVLVANVNRAIAALPVPLALEPVATLVEWPDAEMTEARFLTELLERTGAGLLLDLANMHVNAGNRRSAGGTAAGGPELDPVALLDALPLDRVAYVHVAGGLVRDGRYHDSHSHALWPEVVPLVEELWARTEPPGILLERDTAFPPVTEIEAELAMVAGAAARGRARRAERPVTIATPRPAAPTGEGRPPSRTVRRRLGRAQGALVRAMTSDVPAPAGFARDDVEAMAGALAMKRARAVSRVASGLGAEPELVAWARRHPQRRAGAIGDALALWRARPRRSRNPGDGLAVAAAALASGRRRALVTRSRNGIVVGLRVGRRWTARSLPRLLDDAPRPSGRRAGRNLRSDRPATSTRGSTSSGGDRPARGPR